MELSRPSLRFPGGIGGRRAGGISGLDPPVSALSRQFGGLKQGLDLFSRSCYYSAAFQQKVGFSLKSA